MSPKYLDVDLSFFQQKYYYMPIGKVLRRIMGKTVSAFLKEELKEALGPFQVCAGHSAGAKAAIHVLNEVFTEQETNGILLIDASNALNIMNHFATLHSIQITVLQPSQNRPAAGSMSRLL